MTDTTTNKATRAYDETLAQLILQEGQGGFKRSRQHKIAMHAAIESIAAHIKADAWDEGVEHARRYPWGDKGFASDNNPYRPEGQA